MDKGREGIKYECSKPCPTTNSEPLASSMPVLKVALEVPCATPYMNMSLTGISCAAVVAGSALWMHDRR